MILCKVLQGLPEEVPSILAGKFGLKHAGPEVGAMAQIAKAAKARSLEQFQQLVSGWLDVNQATGHTQDDNCDCVIDRCRVCYIFLGCVCCAKSPFAFRTDRLVGVLSIINLLGVGVVPQYCPSIYL